jgi:membrane-anchored protein YejM (alkaline phosphatase superfamily)
MIKPTINIAHPTEIKYDDRTYKLNHPLEIFVIVGKDGDNLFSCKELDMTAHGDSFESAREAFCFTFDATYKNYAEESDEKLTVKAKKLKKKLLELVKEIL